MRKSHTLTFGSALGALAALPAPAADIGVKLELPEISTGMYERPYVAVFIEKSDDSFVRSLSLWHRISNRRGGPPGNAGPGGGNPPAGDRYLNSLREWWRASGTTSQLPIDGVSSATRAPGVHEVVFSQGKAPLEQLPAGKYQLIIEVAREIKGPRGPRPPGGEGTGPQRGDGPMGPQRGEGGGSKDALESLRIPFEWPVKKLTTVSAMGKAEVGAVVLTLTP
jgi:hypothetical protein